MPGQPRAARQRGLEAEHRERLGVDARPFHRRHQTQDVGLRVATPDLADIPAELLADRGQCAAQPLEGGHRRQDLRHAVLRGQPALGRLALRHVEREAARVPPARAVEVDAPGEEHVLERAIGAAQPRLVVAQRLGAAQAFDEIGARAGVDVELADVMPDVLLESIAEHGQLGVIGVEDDTVSPDEVDRHRGGVEEVPELLGRFAGHAVRE